MAAENETIHEIIKKVYKEFVEGCKKFRKKFLEHFESTCTTANVIKLFSSSMTFHRKARVFLPAKCFRHSLLFVYETAD